MIPFYFLSVNTTIFKKYKYNNKFMHKNQANKPKCETLYVPMIRPLLEYNSLIWWEYHTIHCKIIESFQRILKKNNCWFPQRVSCDLNMNMHYLYKLVDNLIGHWCSRSAQLPDLNFDVQWYPTRIVPVFWLEFNNVTYALHPSTFHQHNFTYMQLLLQGRQYFYFHHTNI